MTMNQSTILPSEVRERIRIELARGPVSNCGDVPARSPFVEGLDGKSVFEIRDSVVNNTLADYGHVTADIEANQMTPTYKQRELVTVPIVCGKCGNRFTYVGRNPKGKRFCDACLAKTAKKSQKRNDAKRRERRK